MVYECRLSDRVSCNAVYGDNDCVSKFLHGYVFMHLMKTIHCKFLWRDCSAWIEMSCASSIGNSEVGLNASSSLNRKSFHVTGRKEYMPENVNDNK